MDSGFSSCSSSVTEQGFSWEDYKTTEVPQKSHPKVVRNLRYIVLNVYRRLFTLAFLVNVGVLVWVAMTRKATVPYLGTIVIGNIFASVLIRQDHIVNGLFYTFTSVTQS